MVKDLIEQGNEIGYHGLMIEQFSCDETLYVAIDETVGSKLFYHVVESDKVATIIIKEAGKRKLPGVFNFIPLNKISPKQHVFPKDGTGKSFLIKEKLEFNEECEKAIQWVFGMVLVCKDMNTVVDLVRKSNLDCVTLDGEKGSRGGVLSGGYINPAKSKIGKFVFLRNQEQKLDEIIKDRDNKERELQKVDKEIKENNKKIQ